MSLIQNAPGAQDFLLPFLRLGPRFLAGMTAFDGATLNCEDLLAKQFTAAGAPAPGANNTATPLPFLTFGGTSDGLTAADAAWNKITGALTMIAVVKTTTGAGIQSVISKYKAGGNLQYQLAINGGSARIDVDGSSTDANVVSVTRGTVTVGSWAFIAGVYDPSGTPSITAWNSLVSTTAGSTNSTSIPSSLNNGSASLCIGQNQTSGGAINNPMNGSIALAALYPYAMGATAMARLIAYCKQYGVA
jgi:hypothetical protein